MSERKPKMRQQIDVKVRIVLIVWNLLLTVAVIAMSFRLASVGAQADAAFQEQIVLLDLMVETDEALMRASENHSIAIMANTDSIFEATEGLLYIIKVHREDHVESIAEIYQGHIIPLRAFHMENLDE